MDVRYLLEILFVLHALFTVSTKSVQSKSSIVDMWAKLHWNDAKKTPIAKYAQLFNVGAHGYVKITNKTIEATTQNDKDPDTYLQINMFGPVLMAIRSCSTKKYICYNNSTGLVEMKVTTDFSKTPGCLFYKRNNKRKTATYTSYMSALNKTDPWYLAFFGKGKKKGQPKKGQKTVFDNNASRYLEIKLSRQKC